MNHALLAFAIALPLLSIIGLAVTAGFGIHKHKDRFRLAYDVLRGRVSISNAGQKQAFRCDRTHVDANHESVGKDDLVALRRAANELTFALGYITHVGKGSEYAEAVEKVIDKK